MDKKLIRSIARKMFYIANKALPQTCVQKWSNLEFDSQEAFLNLAFWHLKQIDVSNRHTDASI